MVIKTKLSKDCEYNINGKDIRSVNSNIDYTSNGSIRLKSKTINQVEIGNAINTLGSILQELCYDLTMLTTTGSEYSHSASPIFIGLINSLQSKVKLTFK